MTGFLSRLCHPKCQMSVEVNVFSWQYAHIEFIFRFHNVNNRTSIGIVNKIAHTTEISNTLSSNTIMQTKLRYCSLMPAGPSLTQFVMVGIADGTSVVNGHSERHDGIQTKTCVLAKVMRLRNELELWRFQLKLLPRVRRKFPVNALHVGLPSNDLRQLQESNTRIRIGKDPRRPMYVLKERLLGQRIRDSG